MKKISITILILVLLLSFRIKGQDENFTAVRVVVDFSHTLQDWDGFGFNYVETAQTMDYNEYPQEYGGFSLLNEKQKNEIIEYVFGDKGLKVGLVKMFLDPFHQEKAGGGFNHERTTKNMREFVRKGLVKTRERGDDLTIITTLYGPPAYTTKQKVLRGRDMAPAHKEDIAKYMIDWVKFLKEKEGFPVKYISLHNEGEDWLRWNNEGLTDYHGHDYNMFWPPEQVVDFLAFMPQMLKKDGLDEVSVTNGETTNWYRFGTWGYASAIFNNKKALNNLGLITSHGFYSGNYGRWFGEHKSAGIDKLKSKRPELHTWVTSTSWSNMDAKNIKEMHGNIYTAKVNGIIPWAGIQRPPHWVGGDPNPGSAFTVKEDGEYEVRRGYYFYKQITRAGQPGMKVVETSAMDSEIAVIAFESNGTKSPDAFIIVNICNDDRLVSINLKGTKAKTFEAYRTLNEGNRKLNLDWEKYDPKGDFTVSDGKILYNSPKGSVTTFFAK